ncbi:Octanoyltransferase [Buchnera aphidicola (Tetraneura ulmi)]|uniref:lipoyl(octanoyl) transferase LipB n=1 Tax=Buchnera aphidicola TaxID=9 RepID=UPI00346439A1
MNKKKVIIRKLGIKHWINTFCDMHNFISKSNLSTLDEIWFLEHYSIFTQGRHGNKINDNEIRCINGISVINSDRGGGITYHGPGQQIIYLLINLKRRKIYPRKMIFIIAEIVLNTLKKFSINGIFNEKNPGIYVDDKKICSIGLRIKNGFSLHGFSLNVDMDLSPFDYINPCGIKGIKMTQMKNLNSNIFFNKVQSVLLENFLLF